MQNNPNPTHRSKPKIAQPSSAFKSQKHSGESTCAFENVPEERPKIIKTILAFDIDQTLNIAKTPIPPEMAEILTKLLDYFEICPISGQKFEQFLIQIVDELIKSGATESQLAHLHLFVAQGTQYYRYNVNSAQTPDSPNSTQTPDNPNQPSNQPSSQPPTQPLNTPQTYNPTNWEQVYNYPLTPTDVVKITTTLEQAAKKLGFWEADKLKPGDEIIENRLSQVTFSALGQAASTEEKYAWDPDCKKREKIVAECRIQLPDFLYEIGGTTSINIAKKGMNKSFGMTHLLEELGAKKSDVLYFGDMTQPGGNDFPVVEMGIDTITVRSHEDTLYALRGILALL